MDARRLRVVFLVDGFNRGGTELNAVRWAEGIDRSRYDLTVVGMSRRGPLLERYERAGIRLVDFSFRGMLHPQVVPTLARLTRWLREERVDVLHCHDKYSNMFGALCGRLAGVPLVVASRRFQVYGPRRFAVGNRLAFRAVDRVLANEEGVRRLLVDEGVPAAKVVVVPNFLDEAAFAPIDATERAARRAALGVGDDALLVGCVARLHPVKDHPTLVRAFARLRAVEPRAVLALVGDGEMRPAIAALAAELGVADAVRFAGERAAVDNLHHGFDVSTLASVAEGFPNSVIEAMAARVPVVATDVGAVRDAVADGETGYVVRSGDHEGFGDALITLARDPARRAAFGEVGHARAAARYRRDPVFARLYALWEEARTPRR